MTADALGTFALLWLLAAAAPGPNVAYSVGTGLVTPLPKALFAGLGIALGGLVYAVLVSAGLGTLLTASADAFTVVKWIGVVYLLWLSWRQWHAADRQLAEAQPLAARSGGRILLRAAGIMLANPKAMLAYAAIFPAFVAPGAPALPQFALLSAISAACSLAVHTGYIVLAGRLGGWRALRRRPRLVGRCSAGLYFLAAGALALVRRGAA